MTLTTQCININNKCIQACFCHKRADGTIVKECDSISVYNWESHIYVQLLDKHIFPPVTALHGSLVYHTENMKSLREYLTEHPHMAAQIVHEVFSFVKTFKTLGFVHGNLHIDNVLVDTASCRLCVIDYANAYIHRRAPEYKRKSFAGDIQTALEIDNQHSHWDTLTLYLSLQFFFKKDIHMVEYLNTVIVEYIHPVHLETLIKNYCTTMKEHSNWVSL